MDWITQGLLALGSVLLAEVVRDSYHVLAHVWGPLTRIHAIHHKVYNTNLEVLSPELYRKAHWYGDVPEATALVMFSIAFVFLTQAPGAWLGVAYSTSFWLSGLARANDLLKRTDLNHKSGPLTTPPSPWLVNRTYHWRHHFDDGNAYYSGVFSLVDRVMGTSISLKGKTIAITGASGALGQALMQELLKRKAKVIALTSSDWIAPEGIQVRRWSIGEEQALAELFKGVDILVCNHGLNPHAACDWKDIEAAYAVNTFSVLKLMELFLDTVTTSRAHATKEIWINTSEAEVSPAFSPLYELSKRSLGELVTLKRIHAPCVIRKIILGPFKSKLNPLGVMSPAWVAKMVVNLARRDIRNIVVTINPLTYILFPLKECAAYWYYRLLTKPQASLVGDAALTPNSSPAQQERGEEPS
jgi:monoglucosyldiacylglycerol epimerase